MADDAPSDPAAIALRLAPGLNRRIAPATLAAWVAEEEATWCDTSSPEQLSDRLRALALDLQTEPLWLADDAAAVVAINKPTRRALETMQKRAAALAEILDPSATPDQRNAARHAAAHILPLLPPDEVVRSGLRPDNLLAGLPFTWAAMIEAGARAALASGKHNIALLDGLIDDTRTTGAGAAQMMHELLRRDPADRIWILVASELRDAIEDLPQGYNTDSTSDGPGLRLLMRVGTEWGLRAEPRRLHDLVNRFF